MKIITRVGEVKSALEHCWLMFQEKGFEAFVDSVHEELLFAKVKFPLLERAAHAIYDQLPPDLHIPFCDRISHQKSMGGNVLLGILLQSRLLNQFDESIDKTISYIAYGEEWYVSDIIGERVWGYGLLQSTDKTLEAMQRQAHHPSIWVVRSLGAGSHNAIKGGLPVEDCRKVFKLLLSLKNVTHPQVKTGIGWAAKTTARFHPEIIPEHENELLSAGKWFVSKVNIGLERHEYFQKHKR